MNNDAAMRVAASFFLGRRGGVLTVPTRYAGGTDKSFAQKVVLSVRA